MRSVPARLDLHPVNRIAALTLAAGFVFAAILTIGPALGKPFTLDEAGFAARFFGGSETAPRLAGLLFFILTGIVFKRMLDELLRNEDPTLRRIAVFCGALMYAVSPLLLQRSLAVGPAAAGTLFLMIFAVNFTRMEAHDGTRMWLSRAFQALAVALVLLSGAVPGVLLLTGIVAYRSAGRQWKKLLEDAVAVFVPGVLLACGAAAAFGMATGADAAALLKEIFLRVLPDLPDPAFALKVLENFGRLFRWPLYWMSAPFFTLFAITLVRRMMLFAQTRRTGPEDALWAIGLAVWIPSFFIPESGRILDAQHPVHPLFIAAVICGCVASFRARAEDIAAALRDAWWIMPLILFAMVAIAWHYLRIGDYALLLWDHPQAARYQHFTNLYYRPLAVGAAAAVVLWVLGRLGLKEGMLSAALLFCLPVNAALDLNQSAEYVTSEPMKNYGEMGHRPAAEYLTAIARPGATLAIRPDLARSVRVEKLTSAPIRDFLAGPDRARLGAYFASGALDLAVVDRYSLAALTPRARTEGLALLERHYYLDRRIGSFRIYRPKKGRV